MKKLEDILSDKELRRSEQFLDQNRSLVQSAGKRVGTVQNYCWSTEIEISQIELQLNNFCTIISWTKIGQWWKVKSWPFLFLLWHFLLSVRDWPLGHEQPGTDRGIAACEQPERDKTTSVMIWVVRSGFLEGGGGVTPSSKSANAGWPAHMCLPISLSLSRHREKHAAEALNGIWEWRQSKTFWLEIEAKVLRVGYEWGNITKFRSEAEVTAEHLSLRLAGQTWPP